jgi:mono/diheme cytochrome c family protein
MRRPRRAALLSTGVLLVGLAVAGGHAAPAPAADARRGEALYAARCAVCHGPAGRGDGPAEFVLFPKPRDLTSGKFKIRSTSTVPTDDDLFRVVTGGIPGTAMPGWASLTETERRDLVAYVKTLSPVFENQAAAKVTPVPTPPDPTPALLAAGKQLYADAECLKCHGAGGRGDGESADTLRDEWGAPIIPYDFTIGGRMKAGNTVTDVYRTLRNGIGGTPMPAYGDALSEEETWALAYYVLSLARQPAPVIGRETGTVRVRRVPGALPLDPDAAVWRRAATRPVALRTLWLRSEQVGHVRVAALHDGATLAFLLEWDDPVADQATLGIAQFRDAAAVQFPLRGTSMGGSRPAEPSYVMGEATAPVNIWHWKADWQMDVARFRDREDRFAAVVVDSEPVAGDPLFLTGRGAGNPMSLGRRSAVENLNASGVGTITSAPRDAQTVGGQGRWADGTWRVVVGRRLRSDSPHDAQFAAGETTSVAFAVWNGGQRDRNGQKAVTVWQRLAIDR